MINVRRGFVDIEDGQVHFRTAGEGEPPLVMFHRSPSSSLSLEPLIARIAKTRRVVAPDTLGNGHSSPPAAANPDLLYFAGPHLRALNALGIERFDAYGAHTGSKIALELALAHPERVRKVIFDGISLRAPEAAAELLSGIEEVDVDHDGSQLMRAWHMVRDAYLFFPWWKHTADACRDLGLPDPVSLHGEVVDLLASIRTYHLAYRAALVHSNEERLPLLTVPALVACAGSDQLFPVIDEAAALVPGARKAVLPSRKEAKGLDEAVRVFAEFLDS
jgi:pimeloyl-ACP methyl ester carboxylesterase